MINDINVKLLKENPSLLIQLILQNNIHLDLKPLELLTLLYICIYSNTYKDRLSYDVLANQLNINKDKIGLLIKNLLKKKVIGIKIIETENKKLEEYDISPLFNLLFNKDITNPTQYLNKFVHKIETEFSRILSPIEIEFVNNNIINNSYTYEEFELALKEMILAGVRNLKYLLKILENKKYYTKVMDDEAITEIDKSSTYIDWDTIINEN